MKRRDRGRQAGMLFILITVFLDVLGIGIIIPVLPQLVTEFVGGDVSLAARYYGPIAAVYALMQFFFAPVLGALSDRFGRRPVILISLFGFGIDYLILAFAPNLTWLVIGRVLAGITGASFTTANAYIADVSPPEKRAQNYGLVGVAFGLGFIFGPALGGVLGEVWLRLPFLAAAGIVLLNWLYGLLVLPESLPPEARRPFSWRDANPLGSFALLRRYPLVSGLAFAFVFLSLAQRGLETVWVLYTTYRFGWGELENGLTLALVGVMAALVQGGLIRVVVPRLGERRAIVLGFVISTLGFVLYGLASAGWMMLVVIVIASLGAIAGPAIQGLVAGAVPPSEQGGVQGALTALISLTAVVAPLISAWVFSYFTSPAAPILLPGAPFFTGALFLLVALLLVLRVFARHPQPHGEPSTGVAEPEGAPTD